MRGWSVCVCVCLSEIWNFLHFWAQNSSWWWATADRVTLFGPRGFQFPGSLFFFPSNNLLHAQSTETENCRKKRNGYETVNGHRCRYRDLQVTCCANFSTLRYNRKSKYSCVSTWLNVQRTDWTESESSTLIQSGHTDVCRVNSNFIVAKAPTDAQLLWMKLCCRVKPALNGVCRQIQWWSSPPNDATLSLQVHRQHTQSYVINKVLLCR